jgi:hypothetical protein
LIVELRLLWAEVRVVCLLLMLFALLFALLFVAASLLDLFFSPCDCHLLL